MRSLDIGSSQTTPNYLQNTPPVHQRRPGTGAGGLCFSFLPAAASASMKTSQQIGRSIWKKKQFLDIGWYWFHLVLICFNEIGEHHVNDVQMHCMPCQDKVKHCNAFYLAFFCQSTSFCSPASRLPFSAAWEGKTKVFQTHGPFFPCQISS